MVTFIIAVLPEQQWYLTLPLPPLTMTKTTQKHMIKKMPLHTRPQALEFYTRSGCITKLVSRNL